MDDLIQYLVADMLDDVTCGMSDLIHREGIIADLIEKAGSEKAALAYDEAWAIVKSTPLLCSGAPNPFYTRPVEVTHDQ